MIEHAPSNQLADLFILFGINDSATSADWSLLLCFIKLIVTFHYTAHLLTILLDIYLSLMISWKNSRKRLDNKN